MSMFGDRERGEENKFAHDAERLSRARARRDRKLGAWIGQKFLNLDEAAASAYGQSLLALNLEAKGDVNLIAAILERVNAEAEQLTEGQLIGQLDHFMIEALAEIEADDSKQK